MVGIFFQTFVSEEEGVFNVFLKLNSRESQRKSRSAGRVSQRKARELNPNQHVQFHRTIPSANP